MGFLKRLFGLEQEKPKQNDANNTRVNPSVVNQKTGQTTSLNNSKPEIPVQRKTGLSTKDLVALSVAENYKVDESKYPDFWRTKYEIGFPNEVFHKLEQKGYLRQSQAKESLQHLKGTDLKNIASKFDLKTSGKKDDLCTRIAEAVQEEDLEKLVVNRYWILTETGRNVLSENPHIVFYTSKHPYSLDSAGITLSTFGKLFSSQPKDRVRDVLWGEFNRRTTQYYKEASSTGNFYNYCELLRTMSLFLEEEGRHRDALDMYMRHLHYKDGYAAGFKALQYYQLSKDFKVASEILFVEVEMLPYTAKELLSLSEACGFDSNQLKSFMFDSLSKIRDEGMFSSTDLTDLIMYGLGGDKESQERICKKAMKAGIKKIPTK